MAAEFKEVKMSRTRHPDAHLLSSLEGPAVMATVAGVLRAPPKNPELVFYVLGNVHIILGRDPTRPTVLESLGSFEQFLQMLQYIDQDSIAQIQLDLIQRRQKARPEAFRPSHLAQVSHACAKFAQWVNAVCSRADIFLQS